MLDGLAATRALGRELADSRAVLFLGRHVGYPVALEGALKLKELAYMHAEGVRRRRAQARADRADRGRPAGHRGDALAEGPGRAARQAAVSNIQEIQARGARTIVIAEEGDETVRPFADHMIEVPSVPTLLQPLVSTVPLQVFAAEIARARGYDVDKPRNLAKSVTVE